MFHPSPHPHHNPPTTTHLTISGFPPALCDSVLSSLRTALHNAGLPTPFTTEYPETMGANFLHLTLPEPSAARALLELHATELIPGYSIGVQPYVVPPPPNNPFEPTPLNNPWVQTPQKDVKTTSTHESAGFSQRGGDPSRFPAMWVNAGNPEEGGLRSLSREGSERSAHAPRGSEANRGGGRGYGGRETEEGGWSNVGEVGQRGMRGVSERTGVRQEGRESSTVLESTPARDLYFENTKRWGGGLMTGSGKVSQLELQRDPQWWLEPLQWVRSKVL